jgi:hypothetical protein
VSSKSGERRVGRRGAVAGSTVPADEVSTAGVSALGQVAPGPSSKLTNNGLEYKGLPSSRHGLLLPPLELTWGNVLKIVGAIILAIASGTVVVVSFANSIRNTVSDIDLKVSATTTELRNIKEAETRSEERVTQLQRTVDDTRNQLVEHRRVSESRQLSGAAPKTDR